jgi:TM2 domain-containing membrane protein YozV
MIIRSFLTCISLCAIFLTEAQDTLSTAVFRQQAEDLYRAGQYFQAGIAWERVLFEDKDPQIQLAAVLGKTECLKQQSAFDAAVAFLESWQAYPFPDSGLVRVHSQQVLCTYLGGHFENVISLVDRWPYEHAGAAPESWLVILKILSLNELQRWKEAGEAYRGLVTTSLAVSSSSGLSGTLPDLYAQLPRLKSVSKAQALSTFIPGAGQFYAGRPGEALFSIFVQAAGIYIAVVSFDQGYYVSAWLIGAALFGAFHMGGVRRAEVLVEQYNRKKILAFNEKLKAQLLALLSPPK